MRLRLLAFVPPAVLIAALLLASASSLVSAIEARIVPEPSPPPITLTRYESECELLFRQAHELSHAATSCEVDPECEESPLLCPVATDVEIEREYQTLRRELHERCGVSLRLMDFAWGGPYDESHICGAAHDWLETAARGERDPTTFLF